MNPQIVEILEESPATGGNFRCDMKIFNVNTGDNTFDFSYKIPISILTITMMTHGSYLKDNIIDFIVGHNTNIGLITQDVSQNDIIINVDQNVIDNIQLGFHIKIKDDVNTSNGGKVINIDSSLNTITIETGSENDHLLTDGTSIRRYQYLIKDYVIFSEQSQTFGGEKIGTMSIPALTTMRIKYNNVSNYSGIMGVKISYLY